MEQDEFRRGLDEILRAQGEIVRRLGQQGVRGIGELVELFERVRRALDAVTLEELDAGLVRLATLLDALRLTRLQLDRLTVLRSSLGLSPPPATERSRDPAEEV